MFCIFYFQNQFFITQMDSNVVLNGIAQTLFERIQQAHAAGENFRYCIETKEYLQNILSLVIMEVTPSIKHLLYGIKMLYNI